MKNNRYTRAIDGVRATEEFKERVIERAAEAPARFAEIPAKKKRPFVKWGFAGTLAAVVMLAVFSVPGLLGGEPVIKLPGVAHVERPFEDSFYLNGCFPSGAIYIDNRDFDVICFRDGWLYYENRLDKDSLYKIRPDGTEKTKLSNDKIRDKRLYFADGWIYYASAASLMAGGSTFYKVREDGTGRIQVFHETEYYTGIKFISDGWIYYHIMNDEIIILESDGLSYGITGAYKIRTDGTEKTKITDDAYEAHDEINILLVEDGWIYYSARISGQTNIIFSISPQGGLIAESTAYYAVRTDGTEKIMLHDGKDGALFLSRIVDGWLYYVDHGGSPKLCKMRPDGTERTVLANDVRSSEIYVLDGWVYYSKNARLFRVGTDGTGEMQLGNGLFNNLYNLYEHVFISDGWIHYYYQPESFPNPMRELGKTRIDGTENAVFADDATRFIGVEDGWVYYLGQPTLKESKNGKKVYVYQDSIYKVRIDGTDKQEIKF